jgi:hypothetical protein
MSKSFVVVLSEGKCNTAKFQMRSPQQNLGDKMSEFIRAYQVSSFTRIFSSCDTERRIIFCFLSSIPKIEVPLLKFSFLSRLLNSPWARQEA